MTENNRIPKYQDQLERTLINSNISALSNTYYDEQSDHLREDYTLEDFRDDYSRVPSERQYDVLILFLTYRAYLKIEPVLLKKPTVEEPKFLKQVYTLVEAEFFRINKINGYLSQAPELVVRDVVAKLKRDLITKWYSKYTSIKETKVDPKGLDRVSKLNNAYNNIVKENKGHVLGKGRLFNKDTYILLRSPNRDEILGIYLYDKRGVIAHTIHADKEQPVVFKKLGSVTGTTLKEVKETVRLFAKQSKDKAYWTAVSDFVTTSL